MNTFSSDPRPVRPRVVAASLLVLLAAGCTDAAGHDVAPSPGSGEAAGSSPAPSGATGLQGTWRTSDVPVERVRAAYIAAGASAEQTDDFMSEMPAENTVQFEIRIGEETWDQYEHDDGGTAVHGWTGTYTVQGAEVHAHDMYTCAIVYSTAFDDAGRLTIEVLSDQGTDPECGGIDFLAQQAIYESAPFARVG